MNATLDIFPECIEIGKALQIFQFKKKLGRENIKTEVAGGAQIWDL
jgi:hypothetical protein